MLNAAHIYQKINVHYLMKAWLMLFFNDATMTY